MAEITAARLNANGYGHNVVAFGLSPPGTLWSSKKFGFDISDLDGSVITVAPRRDPVPMVDAQGGAVQHIKCSGYAFWSCHSSIRSLCESYHSCGAGDEAGNAKLRNVEFVQCLCIEGKDWNNCTMLNL